MLKRLLILGLMAGMPAWAAHPCQDSYNEYSARLLKRIQGHWQPDMKKALPRITLKFNIDSQGNLSGEPVFVDKSTNDKANALALKAVTRALPFDPLPACHTGGVLEMQVGLGYDDSMGKKSHMPTAPLSPQLSSPENPDSKPSIDKPVGKPVGKPLNLPVDAATALPALTPLTPALTPYRQAMLNQGLARWKPLFSDRDSTFVFHVTVDRDGKIINQAVVPGKSDDNFTYTFLDALLLSSPFGPLPQGLPTATFELTAQCDQWGKTQAR
jgi:TonB C terminal